MSAASHKTQEDVDLEAGAATGGVGSGVKEIAVDPGAAAAEAAKEVRDCRICHLGLEAGSQENGVAIELGCCCKSDLAAAHKQCAEAWFKIKGNKTCEICGSIAQNVSGVPDADLTEQWSGANEAAATEASSAPVTAEPRNFWQGHRFLNFLLACVVFAFVLSWLFHFNVPS